MIPSVTVNKLLLLFYLFNKNVSQDAYDVRVALIYHEKIILILSTTNIIKSRSHGQLRKPTRRESGCN